MKLKILEKKEAFAKVVLYVKNTSFLTTTPYPSIPFPLEGAREVVAPQSFPAPSRGKDVRRTGRGLCKNFDFCKRLESVRIRQAQKILICFSTFC